MSTEEVSAARPPAPWAHGRGLALVPLEAGGALPEGVLQALRDGIERGLQGGREGGHEGGHEGAAPALLLDARTYRIVAAGIEVGVLAVRTGWPRADAATVLAVAIDPARRGRSSGMRALVLAERALIAEGCARTYAVVPRGNGHGMYFMLRCGYAPILGPAPATLGDGGPEVGVTWFARVGGRGPSRGA